MTKSGTSNLFFPILISPYPMSQPTRLENCFRRKICAKITSIQGRNYLCQERLSITLSDSSSPSKSEFFKQLVGLSRTNLPIFVIPAITTDVPKYLKDDMQRILKLVLEVQTTAPASASALAPATFAEPWKKLKAYSMDIYCGKSYINCYNFCQQCEDYFATARATGSIQIPFATSFL